MIWKNNKYKRIGEKLIEELEDFEEVRNSNVRIVYLSSDEEKRKDHKIIFADCRKVNKQYEWCCPFDFMITVYEPNVCQLNRKQMQILIRHELMHVGIDNTGNEPSYYVAPHDVEEFRGIINEHGLNWAEEGKDA